MSRLLPVEPATATGETKELLDGIQTAFGRVPNSLRTMAVNPAVLKSWIELNRILGATLTSALNEQIAIVMAEANGCVYCLSAHTAIGRLVGLDEHELARSRAGESADPKKAAALGFALGVHHKRGSVSATDLAHVRAAGYDDAEIAAIIGHVALNVLTNYFNNVAEPLLDYPVVEPHMGKAA